MNMPQQNKVEQVKMRNVQNGGEISDAIQAKGMTRNLQLQLLIDGVEVAHWVGRVSSDHVQQDTATLDVP